MKLFFSFPIVDQRVQRNQLLFMFRGAGQIGLPAGLLFRRGFFFFVTSRGDTREPRAQQKAAGRLARGGAARPSRPLSPFTRRKAPSHSRDEVAAAGMCVCVRVHYAGC